MNDHTGELVVSAMSERHLEALLGPMARDLAAVGAGFARSSVPEISLRETVVARSSQTCMAKSPNKHTRLWMTAEPLPAGLADAIESGSLNTSADRAALSSQLHTWEVLVRLLLCFLLR
jgi:elongation factor 2